MYRCWSGLRSRSARRSSSSACYISPCCTYPSLQPLPVEATAAGRGAARIAVVLCSLSDLLRAAAVAVGSGHLCVPEAEDQLRVHLRQVQAISCAHVRPVHPRLLCRPQCALMGRLHACDVGGREPLVLHCLLPGRRYEGGSRLEGTDTVPRFLHRALLLRPLPAACAASSRKSSPLFAH